MSPATLVGVMLGAERVTGMLRVGMVGADMLTGMAGRDVLTVTGLEGVLMGVGEMGVGGEAGAGVRMVEAVSGLGAALAAELAWLLLSQAELLSRLGFSSSISGEVGREMLEDRTGGSGTWNKEMTSRKHLVCMEFESGVRMYCTT